MEVIFNVRLLKQGTWDSAVDWITKRKKLFLYCEHGGHLLRIDFYSLMSSAANFTSTDSGARAGVGTAGVGVSHSGTTNSAVTDSGAGAGVGTAVFAIIGSGAAVSGVSHSGSSNSGATDSGAGAGFGVGIGISASVDGLAGSAGLFFSCEGKLRERIKIK